MAPDGGRIKNNNGTLSRNNVLKKGPWTTTEDAILMEYVKKHGEGNWNAVQRNCGLMRCGKSCRLRWANHLRPNLKKGSFSFEEETLIVQLHANLGNKWARMAAQMPGRTDNEIKNYWNTRLKRRQRAGLPVYPQDMQPQNHEENSTVNSPFDHQNTNYNFSLDIFNPSTMKPSTNLSQQYQFNNPSSPYNNQLNLFRDPRLSLSLTLASSIRNSQLSLTRGLSNSMPMPPNQHDYPNFSTTTRSFTGISSNPNGLILGMGAEHPLGQSSNATSSNDFMKATSSDDDNYVVDHGLSRGNSTGLLQDLLEESQTLTRTQKLEDEKSVWEEYGLTTAVLTEESIFNFAQGGEATNKNSQHSTSHLNSSSGISTKGISLELGNEQVDDDIMRFLDNFPLAEPVPDWCNDGNDQMQAKSG